MAGWAAAATMLVICTACGAISDRSSEQPPVPPSTTATTSARSPSAPVQRAPTSTPTRAPTPTPEVTPEATQEVTPEATPEATTEATPEATTDRTGPDDPRWQFFVRDQRRHRSPWFDGAQRIMIGYGCTPAPFYAPDPRCDGDGFHHGIDVALPCRTDLYAGVDGRVISPDRPGTPGPAYGSTAFRIRVSFRGETYDVLIGHATRVFVAPGDRVRAGERIATAGARGSPDGCHLHFEQRRVDGGVAAAVDPRRLLDLQPV